MPATRDAPGQLLLTCYPKGGDELHKLFAAYDRERGGKPNTRKTRRQVISILETIGVHTIDDLGSEDNYRRFVEYIDSRKWKETTRYTLRITLHSAIRFAYKKGDLQTLPKLPKLRNPGNRRGSEELSPTKHHRPPAQADRSRLKDYLEARADTLNGLELQALVMTVSETEIRLVDALRLKRSDIDLIWLNRIRYFPWGSRRPRYAPISPRLKTVLYTWLKYRYPDAECDSDLVFPDPSNSGPWSEFSARRSLRAACRAASSGPITFDQLRR
jgi:integrase